MSMTITLSFSCHSLDENGTAASYFVPHLQRHLPVILTHQTFIQEQHGQFRKKSKRSDMLSLFTLIHTNITEFYAIGYVMS